MEVTLAVLADYANVTAEGKLNILGIFGVINPPQLPYRHPQMHLVFTMKASAGEMGRKFKLEVKFIDADGKQIFNASAGDPLEVPQGQPGGRPILLNHILGLNGLPFTKAGDYQFEVLIDDDSKATVALQVNKPATATSAG
jgi:hypothetical protein